MNAILNTIIPNRKVKIRIIKDGWSSPLLGNIYIGMEPTLNANTAARFVKAGFAEYVDAAEDKGAIKDPVPEPSKEDKHMSLADAIKALDPEEETHWTKGGLPDLNALKEMTGEAVKRQDVDEAAPEFTREKAAANEE